MTPIPILLDCDPGYDDAIALLLALASPEVELRGVTTVAGNQTLEKTTANALRVLELAGREDVDGVSRQLFDRPGQATDCRSAQLTFGSACSVIATPATRMTRALAAGRRPTSRPSKPTRENVRFAKTARSPTPVIASASPALKATIRTSPNATRCSEIAASRTTSAEGQGRRPPETPTATSDRRVIRSWWSWWWWWWWWSCSSTSPPAANPRGRCYAPRAPV